MQKSSALEIIRTFTPGDTVRFEDFLKSLYFNKNSNVMRLFELIKKHSPEYNSDYPVWIREELDKLAESNSDIDLRSNK